jgi:YVTN family beta-propeller protein
LNSTLAGGPGGGPGIRTFLIADVRGYTLFTQERGDEAAAKLAARFAEVAQEEVEARGGSLIELRGDEALAVFGSPRQAIRASVQLQERFVDETLADPSLPLTVGIGLDAGEAVAVGSGYRGGALNLAARLCGQAGPGEILASQEVVHLARRVEGVRYEDRGDVVLKGLDRPVRVIRVLNEREDAALRLAPHVPPKPRTPVTPPGARFPQSLLRGRGLVALLVAVAVVAGAVAVPLLLSGGGGLDEFAPDSAGLIDVENGSLLASVDLGARPHSIAVEHGAAWVTLPTRGVVSRIDTKTRSVVETIPVGLEPAGIALSDNAVWVANSGERTLTRIDADTNTVVDNIDVGNGPTEVEVAFGSVWVVNTVDGTVARIDPEKGAVTKTVYVGDGPTGVAAGDKALWITNSAGATVSRISPETTTVVQTQNVGNGPAGVAVLPDGVWVANRLDGTVSRIDPDTNAVTGVPVGRGPSGVAAAGEAIWVANQFDGTISRIDMATRETRTIRVGNAPTALAPTGGTLWVAVGAAAPSHLGGTLRVVSERGPTAFDRPSIDPALAFDGLAWQLFVMTNDGLVGFRRVPGAEGSLLVPDLATSLPHPTDGGTTYTFQVRPGIRYSTGAEVRPEDFRHAIERVYTAGPSDATAFYDGILGSDRCAKSPSGCDLSAGIETTEDTVTFHLERSDPDFLYKLAMPFADALPSDTPTEELTEPAPATGPYMFETYDPQEGLVLVRNPHFREWSRLAQPDGYPGRIEWRFGFSERKGVDEVLRGEADWFYTGDLPFLPGVEAVMREEPELVHHFPLTQTFFMSLGTTNPPFDDPRVRQALNFAVDRNRIVELMGGPIHARLTCQLLPPSFPGYEPYCPYTIDPDPDGTWTAPDLARAQELIRRTGVQGTEVEVWGFPLQEIGAGLKVTQYFTELLNALGFRASHRPFSDVGKYFGRLYTEKPQIGIAGWIQDYPAPSNFIDLLLSCRGFANSTGLCDRQIDRMIDQALRLQAVDPPRAYELWARTERRIVDLAPVVPLVNSVGVDIVSQRVGNYQRNPQWGLLLDQLWIR